MSPPPVLRYRVELLVRKEFKAMSPKVLGAVRGRLRASGVSLDVSDLEACYAHAWQGLHTDLLAGKEIENREGWLVTVTFRRAIDEHRSRRRSYPTQGVGESDGFHGGHGAGGAEGTLEHAIEHDFAGELDNRIRLRQLFEGLRGRLSAREQEAATFCYLQGMSRSEAAARMGISEARMRKLMEGPGAGRPGVAGKVGELIEAIRGGSWCEEQGSLMRGYAFGVLDPEGERYRLALAHQSECPACRAYIRSLRGLAEVLPPLPALMHWVLGGAAAGAGAGAHASAGHASAGAGGGASAGVGAGGGAGAGVGVASAGGAAGATAGGGWLFAGGGIGAKLAVGCLVAALGAGCVALTGTPLAPRHAVHHRHIGRVSGAGASGAQDALSSSVVNAQLVPDVSAPVRGASSNPTSDHATVALSAAAKASREFGPEQALAGAASASTASSSSTAASPRNTLDAKAASTSTAPREFTSTATPASGGAPQARSSSSSSGSSSAGSAAQREFGIG
jgi:DNA-directed RNA polymerase specialized sigma24 family protein